jgi:hypothetical protein
MSIEHLHKVAVGQSTDDVPFIIEHPAVEIRLQSPMKELITSERETDEKHFTLIGFDSLSIRWQSHIWSVMQPFLEVFKS